MLEQAQQVQSQLMAAQEELANTVVDGSAGGVTVRLTGTAELQAVDIPVGQFDGADADSLSDLGDLVVAAYRDAKEKVDTLAARTLGPISGALGGGALGADPEGGFGV
jgi:hypothetical protein